MPEVCVVYLVRRGDSGPEVLVGRKLTGLGAGNIVAPGGKLELGESPVVAAARELNEETSITVNPSDLDLVGEIDYFFPSRPSWNQKSWVFRSSRFAGEVIASQELAAAWVPVANLKLEEMWDDARHWLPDVLAGGNVRGSFVFDNDLATVATMELNR